MLKSSNFWVNIINLMLGFFVVWGSPVDLSGAEVLDTIFTKDIGLISLMVVNFINPIKKIIANGAYKDLAFLKSRNFMSQALTALFSGLASFTAVSIPLEGAEPIADALVSGDIGMIISAIGLNVVNFLVHFFEKKEEI